MLKPSSTFAATAVVGLLLVSLVGVVLQVSADQVEMKNGDRYVGHVLSLNSNTVVVKNDVLGTVNVPRAKVAAIIFGAVTSTNQSFSVTNQASADSLEATNSKVELPPALQQIGKSTNLAQIQAQLLQGAGPEARKKFSELLGGYLTGKLTVDDIRSQAQSAAEQLRDLKRELGNDAGFAIDGYLAILDNFLREAAPAGSSAKKTETPSPKLKSQSAQEVE